MTSLYLLDTDTASYVIKGRSAEIEKRLASVPPSMVCVSVMTRAELLYGLKRLPGKHPLQLAVRQFLKIVRTLPWDLEAADWYAEIRHQLVSAGQPIGEIDMMIAAQAMASSCKLITNNTRHYSRIEAPLVIENWTE